MTQEKQKDDRDRLIGLVTVKSKGGCSTLLIVSAVVNQVSARLGRRNNQSKEISQQGRSSLTRAREPTADRGRLQWSWMQNKLGRGKLHTITSSQMPPSSSRDRNVEDTYEAQNDQRLDDLHSKIRTLRGVRLKSPRSSVWSLTLG